MSFVKSQKQIYWPTLPEAVGVPMAALPDNSPAGLHSLTRVSPTQNQLSPRRWHVCVHVSVSVYRCRGSSDFCHRVVRMQNGGRSEEVWQIIVSARYFIDFSL